MLDQLNIYVRHLFPLLRVDAAQAQDFLCSGLHPGEASGPLLGPVRGHRGISSVPHATNQQRSGKSQLFDREEATHSR